MNTDAPACLNSRVDFFDIYPATQPGCRPNCYYSICLGIQKAMMNTDVYTA